MAFRLNEGWVVRMTLVQELVNQREKRMAGNLYY